MNMMGSQGGMPPNMQGGGLAPMNQPAGGNSGYMQGGMMPTNGNMIAAQAQQAIDNNNYHFRFKIALVGDSGVGKSTFLDAISQTLGSVVENEESSELHIKVSVLK